MHLHILAEKVFLYKLLFLLTGEMESIGQKVANEMDLK